MRYCIVMHSLSGAGMRDLLSKIWGRTSRPAAATPPQIAASRGRDPIVWLIICGALLVATIIVGTIIMVGEFRERALSNNERELENTVQLLARHFDQLFDDCEIITAGLISQMSLSEIASPDAFRERVS